MASTGFDKVLGRLADQDLITPYFEAAVLADNWPLSYNVKIDSSPYYGLDTDGKPDGYFHPSTHPTLGERELYYRFHPDFRDKLAWEPNSVQRQMAFAVGSALHGVVQTQMVMAGLVHPDDIEVEYVNEEHHVRGRIDWMTHHPNGTRLLVEASVRDEFLALFHRFTDSHVLGDSRDTATTISPMIHPDHLNRVAGFVDRARAAGDTIVRGGQRSDLGGDDGLWYEPTLIEPRSNDSEVVQHEIFGPVLTFQTFADEAEAVALANSTPYGLSAIVYTGSQERAERMGRAVRAGTIWTNCFLVRDLTAPFGGCGISGIGREGGDYALDFYSDLKMFQVLDGTTS